MRWDFHKHRSYTECPKRYKHEVDRDKPSTPDNRYYAVRGSVMQKFFELYSNGHYPPTAELTTAAIRKFMQPYYDRELKYNYVNWNSFLAKKDRQGLLEEIAEIAAQNMEKLDIYSEGMRSEVKIEVSLKGGDELVGKIDFLKEEEDGSISLLDGKSTGTLGKNIDVEQLMFYAWLYRAKHGVFPKKLGFVYFQLLQIDWKRFDSQDIAKAVANVLGTMKAAKKAKSFPPTPSASACKYCSFMDRCPEGRKSKESRKRGSRNKKFEDAIETNEQGFLVIGKPVT
jgi:CRISPR/Cas system-associated exonuclease Cas4 (RecB family)